VFWIYFIPMVLSTAGLLDNTHAVYGVLVKYGLPASLLLLLKNVDLKMIGRLGPGALGIFVAGSVGIMLGTAAVFLLLSPVIGKEYWSSFSALSASWMGGSANMIAVKESLGAPDDIFAPMVVVDTIVPYVWMGILVALSSRQGMFDRWLQPRQDIIADLKKRMADVDLSAALRQNIAVMLAAAAGAVLVSVLLNKASGYFPVVGGVLSAFTWTIILASALGLILSLTPLRGLRRQGTEKAGEYALYFVLTCIGARASLGQFGTSGLLIAGGFLIVLIHAIVLLSAAKIMRLPMFLVAAASQANIGGVASGPIVAEVYYPGLAAVGLLMAVLGNIIGTYLGLFVGQICRLTGGVF